MGFAQFVASKNFGSIYILLKMLANVKVYLYWIVGISEINEDARGFYFLLI